MITALNGVIASSIASVSYDADAQLFFNAEAAAGVTLTLTQKSAVNQWVVDSKAAGIWTKFKAIYPMVGGTATAHKFNLKNPLDTNAAFRLVFSGGWTHSSTGMLPNGTNAYADTFFQPSNFTSYPSCSFGYYSRTNIDGNRIDIGANQVDIYSNLGSTAYVRTASGVFTTFAVTNSLGFVMGSRLNNTTQKAYKNGVLTGTTTQTGGTSFLFNIYIGAYNSSGTASSFSNRQCAFAYLSDGLTDLESQLLYQITEKYQVALSRNINTTQSFYYNSAYNNETNAFLFSTQITDNTIQTATNTLVSDLKTAGVFTKMKALYPMVGGTATTHKFNLVNAQDSTAAFALSFVGGWTHSANGALPNGTNAYGNTFLTPSTSLTLNSAHLSFYSRTNSTGNFADMGVANNTTNLSAILIMSKWSDNKFYGQVNDYDFNDNTVADSLGLFCGSRTSSNVQKTFKNGTVVTSKSITSNLLVGYQIPIGARYLQNVAGFPAYTSYSNRQCAFASIGDGLTDAEALALYNAVNSFQVSLGRNV